MPFNISERIIFSLPGGFFRFSPFIRRLFPGSVSGGHRRTGTVPERKCACPSALGGHRSRLPRCCGKAQRASFIRNFFSRSKEKLRSERPQFPRIPDIRQKAWSRSLRGSLFPQSEVSPLRDKRGERTHRSSDRGHSPKEQFSLFRGHTRDPRRQAPCLRSAQRAEPWCLSR